MSGKLEDMDPETPQHHQQSIDVTGLTEEAIETVTALASLLRGQQANGIPARFSFREEWARAIREWAESHTRLEREADDSREWIYAGRGE